METTDNPPIENPRLKVEVKCGELDLEVYYYFIPGFTTELNAEDSYPPEVDIEDIVTACVDYAGNNVKVSVYKVMRETDVNSIKKVANKILKLHC